MTMLYLCHHFISILVIVSRGEVRREEQPNERGNMVKMKLYTQQNKVVHRSVLITPNTITRLLFKININYDELLLVQFQLEGDVDLSSADLHHE